MDLEFEFDDYTVESIESNGVKSFYLTFRDNVRKINRMEISPEIVNVFDTFKKVEKKFLNFFDIHIERSELKSEDIHKRALHRPKAFEEMLEDLHQEALFDKALDSLTNIQRRRFLLHYMEAMTYKKIAEIEGCIISSVHRSVELAKKKFVKFFTGVGKRN